MPLSSMDTITFFSASGGGIDISGLEADGVTQFYYHYDLEETSDGYYWWPASLAAERDIILAQYNAGTIPYVFPDPATQVSRERNNRTFLLDLTSLDRVRKARDITDALRIDTTYAADTTGKKTIEFQGDWRVDTREAASDTVTIGQDLTVTRYGSIYQITIDFEHEGAIGPTDTTTIEGLDYVRAFVAIMNGLTSDTDVDGGAEVGDWSGRTFTLGPYTGETETTTTVTVTDVSVANVSLGQVYFFLTASAGNMDQNVIETWFRAQGVSLSTVMQRPEYGGPISIAHVSEARLPSGNILREDGGQLVLRGVSGLNIPLGVDAGRVPEVRSFSQASGGTDYLITFGPYVRGVYLGSNATADVTARLPRPSDSYITNDVVRVFRVSNESDHTFHTHDWNGNPVIALASKQTMELEYSLDHEGTGRVRVTRVLPRVGHWFDSNTLGNAHLNAANSITINSYTWNLLPLLLTAVHVDSDTFTRQADYTPPYNNRAVNVHHSGEVTIDTTWTATTTTTGSATGLQTRLYRNRGGTLTQVGRSTIYANPSQASSPIEDQRVIARDDALAGDQYIVIARLNPTSSSWNLSTHFSCADLYMRLEMRPEILVEES